MEILQENIVARTKHDTFNLFLVLPSFTEQPRDIDAIIESVALFNCRATGFPRPNIIWVKSGQLVKFKIDIC